ncbi:AMIN domain-containing protein [Desulfovibrio gilichinskyi]|uniref:AMIN domain-containing protein n=1 Tax=Desulfovibrio gilichinskyi TaxID=1519643 RepID=A0A1X7ENN6_9BACT|nr:AMIN domain-containing protein [Desulfovibrio gilichinskyi]SMF36768.1 AMIN domain-containing protein [Desulfovibrio gilichinskyi]
MSARPLTIIFLVIILMGTASYGLYHFGVLDSFLSEPSEVSSKNDNSGPVVRNSVSDLVLPLSSSKDMEETSSNATSEAASVNGSAPETDFEVATAPANESQDDENSQSEHHPAVKKVASIAVTETLQEETKEKPKDIPQTVSPKAAIETVSPKKSVVEKIKYGTLRHFEQVCSNSSLTVKMSLSEPSKKITWFNISKPRKLVVDIHGHWKNFAKSIYRLKGCSVDKIILGEQPDRMRIVFYLNKKDLPAKFKPEIKKVSNHLEIKINL